MLSRRLFLAIAFSALAFPALVAPALAAPPVVQSPDPVAIVKSIYGKHDTYGAAASLLAEQDSRPALSKAFAAIWKKSDDDSAEDLIKPPGFDVVTNSQGLDVKSAAVSIERRAADRVTVRARLTWTDRSVRISSGENVLHYDFVREDGAWKIDDVRSQDGTRPRSLRAILTEVVKQP